MIKSKIVVANWKMNGNIAKIRTDFNYYGQNKSTNNTQVVYAVPNVYISSINELFNGNNANYNLAAQDVSIFNGYGAYTGEVSADMLKNCGVTYVIVGHSERRALCNEDNGALTRKIENLIQVGITPIYCIGESIKNREDGDYLNFIQTQLNVLTELDLNNKNIIIAYEPIWAIGTGLIPTMGQINEVANYIHAYINQNLKLLKVFVLYGGSVNASNTSDILHVNGVDGLLVGGASLKPEEFANICDIAVNF